MALVMIAVGLLPVEAHAELEHTGRGTANVQATGPGLTRSTGTAGFDSSGTSANASSQTPQQGPAGSGVDGGGSSYTYVPIPGNVGFGSASIGPNGAIVNGSNIPAGTVCPTGQTGYYVYDATGAFVSIVCVGGQPPGTAATATALQLAQQASASQPWPNLTVRVSPGRGLTGLPSWFWMGGGSPAMANATASSGALTVTVRATLIGVAWAFGDNAITDSGTNIGQPYPSPAAIEHVYQSDTYGMPNGAPVSATLRYDVQYSVNGGPFAELGTKARPYSTTYVVNQLQPVAVPTP